MPIRDSRTEAVIASALWAAVGDALGWITELGDEGTIRHRTGASYVKAPVDWKRRIGGRFGPTLILPSGTYSDDTQLRLSVCRATRGDGGFDAEAFAKVELPVWSSYSLGAGRGTAAAASNLTKGTVSWFSNFFGQRGERGYLDAGGNGAAMRIQPHVWKCGPDTSGFVKDVLRDAIITHGHPKGFCGALFHAFCVAHAIVTREIPGPDEWIDFADQLRCIPEAILSDEQLSLFWLSPWEQSYGAPLKIAIQEEIEFVTRIARTLRRSSPDKGERAYSNVLELAGGFDERTRGAGLNTAFAAAALAHFSRERSNEDALLLAANTPGSDTDTIATMTGAIIGAARPTDVNWPLQDREYIIAQAVRLSDIAAGKLTPSFQYPDLISWSPPTTQSDAVGTFEDQLWLAGLGRAEPLSEPFVTSEAKWQWLRLEFGQTVLAKQRPKLRKFTVNDVPTRSGGGNMARRLDDQVSLFREDAEAKAGLREKKSNASNNGTFDPRELLDDLDGLTDRIIERGFRPEDIGQTFLDLAHGKFAIERSTAFSAIIAKAIEARRKRSRK